MNNNVPALTGEESAAFAMAWAQFENMIGKNYLDVLPQAYPVAGSDEIGTLLESVQINHVERIVYDKEESTLAKLNNVYSSLVLSGASVFVLLQNTGKNTELYLGVCDPAQEQNAHRTLEGALRGNFPGVVQKPVEHGERLPSVEKISDAIRNSECLAVITGVPSLKEDTEDTFSQGLEKLIDAMGDRPFSALFLSSPIDRERLLAVEAYYQKLYSDLSVFNISSLSLSLQESLALGKSLGKSISNSLSNSLSLATTETVSNSHTDSKSKTHNWGGLVGGGAAAAGGVAGAIIGSAIPVVGTFIGGAIGSAIGGIAGSVIGTFIGSTTDSSSDTYSESTAKSRTETETKTVTEMLSETVSETATETAGKTFQYEVKNRAVADALKAIEEQLERIRVAKSYGAWNWAAYFSAPDIETVKSGAEVYSGILRGEKTGVEHCAVSYWCKSENPDDFDKIIQDVATFRHPVFDLIPPKYEDTEILVSPTALLNTQEMVVGMALPQKSIPGLPVFESVEFGRSVTTYDAFRGARTCEIGFVSRFGSEEVNTVKLDVDSLASHTFVTGSTGSGKSNTVYFILSEIQGKYKIPFLVIEPAKGEYKHVFPDVHVFGTNPYLNELLKINPFSFPENIHITEHIDRLIEILNAVWPMYAAMPAILKEAVELTYRKCGWDLLTSRNEYAENGRAALFPDFVDLLETLPVVIEASKYAEEVKSNYAGSLLTRVKSLTNGYYRNIFQKEELSPETLFDQSCIVDLSRVGSSETKSMLMGVVFLKLQEYRLSKVDQQNVGLRHITVLEEAHNLLRRTSTEQGQESANLQGKAVEMITNAIAEMRTYGEGFIIADQAPGLLDESVIRNTNTKIVLRLPDFDDRLLVGKAQNLSDPQIEELARLKTGCASVYQNNWQEAVLCQVKKFIPPNGKFSFTPPDRIEADSRLRAEECFLKKVAEYLSIGDCSLDPVEVKQLQIYFPTFVKAYSTEALSPDIVLEYYGDFIALAEQIKTISNINDFNGWTKRLLRQVFTIPAVNAQKQPEKDHLLKAVFRLLELQDTKQKDIWRREIEQFEKWRLW